MCGGVLGGGGAGAYRLQIIVSVKTDNTDLWEYSTDIFLCSSGDAANPNQAVSRSKSHKALLFLQHLDTPIDLYFLNQIEALLLFLEMLTSYVARRTFLAIIFN